MSQTTVSKKQAPVSNASNSYLPGRRRYHDHEGGSPRARLNHCTLVVPTTANSPNVGISDCIICGSGGLRPRSPLIVLFNCNKCLTLGLFYRFSCCACFVLPPQCIHWCHWLVVKVTFYSEYTCSPLPQVGCFDQKCLLESLDLPVCWFYCSLCCLWNKDVMSSGFCGDLSETARAYLAAFHWGLLWFVRGIKGGAKKIDKLITCHFTEVFASLQLVLYQKRMVWNGKTLDSREYAWDAPWAKQLCLRSRRLSPMLPTHTYLAGEIPWSWRCFTQGEAQPLHFGCADHCKFPKCGNLNCIICGSGGLRPRSPLIVLFNCNKCLQ